MKSPASFAPPHQPASPAFLAINPTFLVRVAAVESISHSGGTVIVLRGGRTLNSHLAASELRDAVIRLVERGLAPCRPVMMAVSATRLSSQFTAMRLDQIDVLRKTADGFTDLYMRSGELKHLAGVCPDDLIPALLEANGPCITASEALALTAVA